jgi:FKBP-type peptidyl-prolyl cis-trans isomerase FkpA
MKNIYKYFKKLPALFLTGLFLLYSGCFNDDAKDAARLLTADLARIDQYLADHGIDSVEQDPSGRIRYVIEGKGSGASPEANGCIMLRYEGRFLDDGTVFTSSTRSSYPMAGDIIEGWKIGMPQLQEGDTATLYIPSGLAYGPTGLPMQGIPPDAIVYFKLELFHVGETYSPAPSPTGDCK